MKIPNIVLASMVTACSLVSIESNSQISKKPLSEIQKKLLDSVRKVNIEKRILAEKRKKDSLALTVNRIHKYCPGCGKG